MGWNVDPTTWEVNTSAVAAPIVIPETLRDLPPQATTEAEFGGNLDAEIAYSEPRNEKQTLTFNGATLSGPSGRTFTLTYNGVATGEITVAATGEATAAAIQSALNDPGVCGAGNTKVTWNGQCYEIEFQGALARTNIDPPLSWTATATGGAWGAVTGVVATPIEGIAPMRVSPNEIQTLDLRQATNGQFQLLYDAPPLGGGTVSTVDIEYNAAATDIQNALTAAGVCGANNVRVTESLVTPRVFSIEFTGTLANTDIPILGWQPGTTPLTGTASIVNLNNGGTVEYPAGVENSWVTTQEVFDSQGRAETVYFRFFKYVVYTPTPETRWACDISRDPKFEKADGFHTLTNFKTLDINYTPNTTTTSLSYNTPDVLRVTNLLFDSKGKFQWPYDPDNPGDPSAALVNLTLAAHEVGADDIAFNVDFSKLTQYASDSSAKITTQDGYKAGKLKSYTIDTRGNIVGAYDNGVSKTLAAVAMANFTNPAGMQQVGGTLFKETVNSGTASISAAGTNGMGNIAPSSLEMSNVDLSEEFTDMIVTQRGFQANSRIITTSDEMLQELVNLKR